jgi:hypothetical protein
VDRKSFFKTLVGGVAGILAAPYLKNPDNCKWQRELCWRIVPRKIVRAGRRSGKTAGASILAVEASFDGT